VKLRSPVLIQSLAEQIGAVLHGESKALQKCIYGIAAIETAQAGDVTFLANAHYKKYLATAKASAVILAPSDAQTFDGIALITKNPRLAVAKLVALCKIDDKILWKVHAQAVIAANAKIANNVAIGPNCVIGEGSVIETNVVLEPGVVIGNNCIIGRGSRIKANATLYHNISIGAKCILHSGCVIGADGFGYATDEQGNWIKMPHVGGVTIGQNVEIGSNTSIDRGFMENTLIGNNVIIDNQVQIAHNVAIGDKTAIAGCVGIAGSTTIGSCCLIGGGVSIAGHLEIADNVHITATSSVNRSLHKSGVYSSGLPARENHIWKKNVARFQFLDSMAQRIRNLERTVRTENFNI